MRCRRSGASTWAAVLKRQPEASADLAEHLRRFPGSQFSPDALYWLGRLAEEAGNSALARTYYAKLLERFPQNYFATTAAKRLRALGPGAGSRCGHSCNDSARATRVAARRYHPCGRCEPPGARRCAALDRFDASAELELRAAFAATGEPRLLLEAAQEARQRRTRRRGDRDRAPDLSAARVAAVRPSSARSVAHGLRHAVSNLPSWRARPPRAWIPCLRPA